MIQAMNNRHAAPSVLALDLGTQVGWALLADGEVVSGSFNTSKCGGDVLGIRYLRFRRELLGSFRGVREVWYEHVRRHEGTHAAHVYGGFLAHLQAWCAENDIPLHGVEVADWKRAVGCKGNANKDAVMEAVKKRGFTPATHDEADALAILSLARKRRAA